jgi:multicomponent Na+:H+ antiporter subunit D
VQATLFCVAGLVERIGGSTSMTRLAGLAAASPVLAVLYFLPAVNLGGIPPLSGFVGKLGLVEAGVQDGSVLAWLLVGGAVLTSLLTLYVMAKVWVLAFWRPVDQLPAEDIEDHGETDGGADVGRYPELIGAGRPGAGPAAYSGDFLGAPSAVTSERRRVALPRAMTAATAGLVTVGLALTVVAGPLYTLTDRAAADLVARTPYISAVFAQTVDTRVADDRVDR